MTSPNYHAQKCRGELSIRELLESGDGTYHARVSLDGLAGIRANSGTPALLEKGVVMMGRYAVPVFFVVMAVCALCAAAACAPTSGTPVMQAFDRYEAIRVALADDKIDLVSQEATALGPLAGQLAGEEAQAAASRLASATTLNKARLEFISVSSKLVPKFLDAKLPAVHGFMCPLQDGRTVTWAQRSATIQNPYFGKAMLDCGTELPASE